MTRQARAHLTKMDTDLGLPPCHTDPRYDYGNAVYIISPSPPVPHPDSSTPEIQQFLRLFCASIFSLPQDHSLVCDLASRFGGDGLILYSASKSRLIRFFGGIIGERLYETLADSKYGWVSFHNLLKPPWGMLCWLSNIKVYICVSSLFFHAVTGFLKGGHRDVFVSGLSVFGIIIVRTLLRYFINDLRSRIPGWRDHLPTTTQPERELNLTRLLPLLKHDSAFPLLFFLSCGVLSFTILRLR